MGLERLKKEYSVLQRKYGLPSFEEMNKDFYIEKIAENETELLLREIRRMVGDRLANYMRFLESLLNPTNVPMFVFSIVKFIGQEEKKKMSEAYKKLIKNEIGFLERDLEFNEAKEAQFIKDSFVLWQEIKRELSGIFERMEKSWKPNADSTESKGYFG